MEGEVKVKVRFSVRRWVKGMSAVLMSTAIHNTDKTSERQVLARCRLEAAWTAADERNHENRNAVQLTDRSVPSQDK